MTYFLSRKGEYQTKPNAILRYIFFLSIPTLSGKPYDVTETYTMHIFVKKNDKRNNGIRKKVLISQRSHDTITGSMDRFDGSKTERKPIGDR